MSPLPWGSKMATSDQNVNNKADISVGEQSLFAERMSRGNDVRQQKLIKKKEDQQ